MKALRNLVLACVLLCASFAGAEDCARWLEPNATLENPEAFMNQVIQDGRGLRLEEALYFALTVIPEGEEREGLRQSIAEDFNRPDLVIKNDVSWLAKYRASIYKPGGWIWRSSKIKWRARPLKTEQAFLNEVLRAVQMANLVRLQKVYDRSVYAMGPATRLTALVNEAARVFAWKAAVASWDGVSSRWQPTGLRVRPAVNFILGATMGLAFARDLNNISLLAADQTSIDLATAGDQQALLLRLKKRYGWRAYLTWGTRHLHNLTRGALLTVALTLSPEVGATVWHQYNLERPLTDNVPADMDYVVGLSRLSPEELRVRVVKESTELRDGRPSTDAERELAEEILKNL